MEENLSVVCLLSATKQTINKWIVKAISVSNKTRSQPSPMAVEAHSTRSMVASKAFLSAVSLQNVCDAAGWSNRTYL